MKKQTELQKLLEKGFRVQISEMVDPDTNFSYFNHSDETKVIVVHPLSYSYLAYSDPFEAHAENMKWINRRIEEQAAEASKRLDDMVYQMDHKHDPVLVQFPNVGVTVEENGDGTYSFNFDSRMTTEDLNHLLVVAEEAEGAFRIPDEKRLSFLTLKDKLHRDPTFDELMRGY